MTERRDAVRHEVALLAADADEQLASLNGPPAAPIEELRIGLWESWDLWSEGLRDSGMLDDEPWEAVQSLLEFLNAQAAEVWVDRDETLSRPEWSVIRRRAAEVLALLPPAQT